MINTARALWEFWSGFGLPAFTTVTVPDESEDGEPLKLPYITYSLVETAYGSQSTHYAQVWYRATDNQALLEKVDEIKAAIGDGVALPCEGGCVTLRPGEPLVQLMTDAVPEIRYAYISLLINCYHL